MDVAEKKRAVARAALELMEPGIRLGVGTGSTVNAFIDALEERRDHVSVVVASSRATEARLRARGFEVTELNDAGDLDLYVDGADEANKHCQLIKGGGGALTREKIIAGASRRFACIIDESKLVGALGKFPLPIEVIPMAREFVSHQLVRMRGQPIWRQAFTTDNGNHILDVHHLSMPNPLELEGRLSLIPGVVTVGIFAHRPADLLLIADDNGVRTLERR
jgi:ribose 5-phosphate isomerase A